MTILRILLLIFAFSSAATAQMLESDAGLTPIVRNTCLQLPEMTGLEDATQGLQYKVNISSCDSSYSCNDSINVYVNYYYTEVTTTDYVDVTGKAVASRISKKSQMFDKTAYDSAAGRWQYVSTDIGYTPSDDNAKGQLKNLYKTASDQVLLQIRTFIFQGDDICGTSFYK